MVPSTDPSWPITTLPEVLILPSTLPSILKSPSELISPTKEVFFPTMLRSNTWFGLYFFSENIILHF